jgi:hypothetical protein
MKNPIKRTIKLSEKKTNFDCLTVDESMMTSVDIFKNNLKVALVKQIYIKLLMIMTEKIGIMLCYNQISI